MQILKLKIRIEADGHLRIDVPTDLPSGEVELVLVIDSVKVAGRPQKLYDFDDLAGSLGWQGDVVAEQRKLRDEWQ